MPYETSGSLTTDQKTTSSSTGLDTQLEWEAYQSKTNVTITDGTLHLTFSGIPGSAIAHFDARSLSLSDGDTVSTWTDETGNGNDLSATGDPQYQTGAINGNPGVQLDGTDDYFDAVFDSEEQQPNVMFAVMEITDNSSSSNTFLDSQDSSSRHFIWSSGGGDWGYFAGSTVQDFHSVSGIELHTAIFDSPNAEYRVDGSTVSSSDDIGSHGSSGIRLGANYEGANYGDLLLGELIFCNIRPPSFEITETEQRMATDWGISI